MSNETRAKIVKAAPNRWLVFCILTLSGGIAFKLSSMKDMFYVPMQQFMGLSNTQIGGALSAYGIVQTIGLIAGIYICDMFSKKYMIGGSLIGLGAVGVYLSTFPGYFAEQLRSDVELVEGVYDEFDREAYLRGELAPVFFGSAVNNFGVRELLECFVRIAPSPRPAPTATRTVEPAEPKMTGFVFKIHANMDPNHRDRIAFLKICSGTFERNHNYLHVRSGKQLKFSSPTAFMAEKKSVIDFAYPGDIVGLHDTGNFKIGDTFTEGEKLKFTGIPSFAPEQFRYIENADPLKFKQLAKGVDQLMDEGVAQLFVSSLNGRKIIGTVGALQFEVIQYRLEHEYNAACRWEPISIYKACWIESDNAAQLADFKRRKHTNMAVDKHGRDVFLADTSYGLALAQENFKDIRFHFTSEF